MSSGLISLGFGSALQKFLFGHENRFFFISLIIFHFPPISRLDLRINFQFISNLLKNTFSIQWIEKEIWIFFVKFRPVWVSPASLPAEIRIPIFWHPLREVNKVLFLFFELFWGFYRKINKVMFYGKVVWDPFLIVAQIVCLQCLYYLTLGVFLALLVGTRVSKMSLVYFFDYAIVTASTVTGWCVIASVFLSCVAG